MTKREMFEMIASVNSDNAEIVAFCEREVELLSKRNSSSKKSLTKTQKENEDIKTVIVNILAESEDKMTVSDLMECEGLDYSSQKISALLRRLRLEGKVERTIINKKAYFSVVTEG